MQPSPVKVLIVNESLPFRTAVQQAVAGDAGIRVVGWAEGPEEAERKIRALGPDVLVADAVFPEKTGVREFLKSLRRFCSLPAVAVGPPQDRAAWTDGGEPAGSYVGLPDLRAAGGFAAFSGEIRAKLRLAVHRAGAGAPPARLRVRFRVVAIGASTGGTEATAAILRDLPAEMPGIVIVQHMPANFTRMYAERLDRVSRLKVSEAKTGDRVEPGTALVAPGGKHLYLRKDAKGYYVRCARGEKVNGHCPSVDELFNSVAAAAGKEAVGVILTGMGRDGARGLLSMRRAGAYTIGQDRESCVVYGMPMAAYELGAVKVQAPVEKIAGMLSSQVGLDFHC